MKKLPAVLLIVCLLLTSAAVFAREPVAHEGRMIGDYEIVFGWRIEPAYAGVFNGPEITFTHHDTDEPLDNADEIFTLIVQFGDQSMPLRLYPVAGTRGHYTADLIPTRPGDYTFILSGTLDGEEISETFTSADGSFSTVEPAGDILFPALDTDSDAIAALQAQIDDLRAQIEALRAAGS